ncbi:MAG: MutH/Sau3AI family endonuclease [Parapedobacter sp.]
MPEFATIGDLFKYYKSFRKRTLRELADHVVQKFPHILLLVNKGIVGQVLEALVGQQPNNNPLPDIPHLGLELKVLPLRKIGGVLKPKERSKIKSIYYNAIVAEEWGNSELRGKIEHVLFLMYEHPMGKTYGDWQEFVFLGPLLFHLAEEDEPQIATDWTNIKERVAALLANQLSERDAKIVGPSTSGTGKMVAYLGDNEAKQRSYSFKHNYLKYFYAEKVQHKEMVALDLPGEDPVLRITGYLNGLLAGDTVGHLAEKYGVQFSPQSKSAFPELIKAVLAVERGIDLTSKTELKELEERGITIKTVPVNSDYVPYEAMSFPKFSLVDLIDETWEGEGDPKVDKPHEALFKNQIKEGFLLIPVIKTRQPYISGGKRKYRYNVWQDWVAGNIIYWRPSDGELEAISNEWQQVKAMVETKNVQVWNVARGDKSIQKNNLLKQSESQYIYLRAHTRDSSKIDAGYQAYTDGAVSIPWQSFWFNKKFVRQIVAQG